MSIFKSFRFMHFYLSNGFFVLFFYFTPMTEKSPWKIKLKKTTHKKKKVSKQQQLHLWNTAIFTPTSTRRFIVATVAYLRQRWWSREEKCCHRFGNFHLEKRQNAHEPGTELITLICTCNVLVCIAFGNDTTNAIRSNDHFSNFQ